MNNLSSLTGIYPVQKTLKFGLLPMGRTLEHIKRAGILDADEELARNFTTIKHMADEWHKLFIETVLTGFRFPVTPDEGDGSLTEYASLHAIPSKERGQQFFRNFDKQKDTMRMAVAGAFRSHPDFERMDKKELVTELLPAIATADEMPVIDMFRNFTSYLTGYNTIRKNLYAGEKKQNTIAYRIVDDNLPLFIGNMARWPEIAGRLGDETVETLNDTFRDHIRGGSIHSLFSMEYFNLVLSQAQIDDYNAVLGGYTTPEGEHIQGINVLVNLYNQRQTDKSRRIATLKPLKKQILSDRVAVSWVDRQYTSDRMVIDDIIRFHKLYSGGVADSLRQLLLSLDGFDLTRVYIRNNDGLTHISQRLLGRWSRINELMLAGLCRTIVRKGRESEAAFVRRMERTLKERTSFSIHELRSSLPDGADIVGWFAGLGAEDSDGRQQVDVFTGIELAYAALAPLLSREYREDVCILRQTSDITLIKGYMDAILRLVHFIKPLAGDGSETDALPEFYSVYDDCMQTLSEGVRMYDLIRNYMTRKPYSDKKMKLNFGCATLLGGWSVSKEKVSRSVLFRRGRDFYLGIMAEDGKKIFDEKPSAVGTDVYEKMEYELMGGASKMLPKVAFAASNRDIYNPSEEILSIKERGSYKAGAAFRMEDLHKMIDFYKQVCMTHPKWKLIPWQWKETSRYTNLKEFMDSFVGMDYSVEFTPWPASYIDTMVDEGRLYLFRIYNKDFSPHSKGRPDLQTIYFRMLFDDDNLQKVVYKLSGGAEMFYRPASLHPSRPTHPAGVPIDNKRPSVRAAKPKSLFKYDLIKDKRYTEDKFMLHLPICINYSVPDTKGRPVTERVRGLIRQGAYDHIIGIHRGERNLIYLTVIDRDDNIVLQTSLNIIGSDDGKGGHTDYLELLRRREGERMEARRSWGTIENIKQIKEGYIGQVVSVVTDLVLRYNALLVVESLDTAFKSKRQLIESNVYMKFEKMLADKFNYLVKKDRPVGQLCGALRGLQLTDRCTALSDFPYQNGILFFVHPAYVQRIDPVTGFINLFRVDYESRTQAKNFFMKFDTIRYNADDDLFEFKFDYRKFMPVDTGIRTAWTVCTHGSRIHHYREDGFGRTRTVNLTDEFKQVFLRACGGYTGNLKQSIATMEQADALRELVMLFNLTVQMFNTSGDTQTGEDYIISPVRASDGSFFRSDPRNTSLPVSTDANGAYNVARKGAMFIRGIRSLDETQKLTDAKVTTEDWLRYAQHL